MAGVTFNSESRDPPDELPSPHHSRGEKKEQPSMGPINHSGHLDVLSCVPRNLCYAEGCAHSGLTNLIRIDDYQIF